MKFKSTSQYTYNLTHTQQNSNKNIYKNNLRHVTDQDKKKVCLHVYTKHLFNHSAL